MNNTTTRQAYTEVQKEAAHQTDIIDFLQQSEGFSFKKAGHEFHCAEHDSLVVRADRQGWYWNSRQTGGSGAISYCTKIKGMTYPQALETLVGDGAETAQYKPINMSKPAATAMQRALVLPEKAANNHRAFAYLNKTRCIDACIITQLLHDRKLYQDVRNNAVFVGFDEQNVPKFACVRGTLSNKSYRGDCGGSDKRCSFSLDGRSKTKLFVFEAPIDLLSHATLANKVIGRDNAWTVHNRLSLGGVTDVALGAYLAAHPDVKEIVLCLDNDKAGRAASLEISAKYTAKGYSITDAPPRNKDYNEELIAYLQKTKEEKIAAPERCSER